MSSCLFVIHSLQFQPEQPEQEAHPIRTVQRRRLNDIAVVIGQILFGRSFKWIRSTLCEHHKYSYYGQRCILIQGRNVGRTRMANAFFRPAQFSKPELFVEFDGKQK